MVLLLGDRAMDDPQANRCVADGSSRPRVQHGRALRRRWGDSEDTRGKRKTILRERTPHRQASPGGDKKRPDGGSTGPFCLRGYPTPQAGVAGLRLGGSGGFETRVLLPCASAETLQPITALCRGGDGFFRCRLCVLRCAWQVPDRKAGAGGRRAEKRAMAAIRLARGIRVAAGRRAVRKLSASRVRDG